MEVFKYHNQNKSTTIHYLDDLAYITFPKLEREHVVHGMSTRMGGVSKDYLGAMNLSYTRGDLKENVDENHKRFARALGYDASKLVFSDQVHLTNIYQVTQLDCGKGIVKESDIKEIDGLMTNEPGVPMITFYADCVPLLFYDPVRVVIAMAHSGWKGTVAKIGKKMVETMHKTYGSNPEDLICAIAPSICQDCYEVSKDVIDAFDESFGKDVAKDFYYAKGNDKFQLNLQRACEYNLIEAGVLQNHIDVTDICTCCNNQLIFSHRASHGLRGNNGVVMMIPQ